MKTFEQLLNENKTISEKIKTLDEYFSTMKFTEHEELKAGKITVAEFKAKTEQRRKEEVEKSRELDKLEIAQKILKDNIRQAYYAETMPKVLEVLKKYEGKPIGEKTEAKIREELSKQGIYFSINYGGQYGSDYIHVSPTFGSGYAFRYDDMKIYTKYDGGNKRPMLGGNGGNRLIVYDPDIYYLSWCSDYVDDYMFRANTILYKYKELKEQRERLEAEYKSLNDILPRSMERLDINKHLYNSIA